MKKIIITIVFFIAVINMNYAQETADNFKPSGKVEIKIYWNYFNDLTKNATQTSAFDIERSYFGYKYNFSEKFSTRVLFDVGNNTAGSAYTAYLKYALLDWKVASGVKLSMGLIGLKQFNDQEDFWGYRYIFKSYQDQYGFGPSADLGVNAEFKLAKTLKANFLIVNGEGYKNLQDTNGNQKIGGNLIFTPIKGLTTKVYMDSQATTGGKAVTNFALFAGYKAESWRLGAEYNEMNNGKKYTSPADNYNLNGISIYATYVVNKKVELFARYDQLSSNTLAGGTQNWNYSKDGSQFITGLQYVPIKGVSFALNYQGYSFDDNSLDTKSKVFLNAEFKL